MSEERETASRYRSPAGLAGTIATSCLVAMTLVGSLWALELQHAFGLVIFEEQYLALILGFALVATFIGVKASRTDDPARVPWFDWCLSLLSVAAVGYVMLNYREIVHDMANTDTERWVLGFVAILLVFEATRRLVGLALVILAVAVLLYAHFGDMLPGLLAVPPSSWKRIAVYTYLDINGLLGIPLNVAGTTILTFVLFGGVLKAVKGDTFITDLALVAMGRYRGGPAKVAVAASTLFGTVSGSAVSNVAVVGPITIPMMTRAGYPAHQAAAVEAVASTGGQIMPPVMGITAFLIADYLSISYGEVVLAALIPALLYYLAVFVQVDLEAARRGLTGVPRDRIPRLRAVLSEGYAFLVPLGLLIYTIMVEDWQPGLAGLTAAAATLAIGMFRATTRPSLRTLWQVCVSTGRTMLDMLVLTAIAGIIIGAVQLSGASFNMSTILLSFAGDNVLSILFVTGLVCAILGMALPTAVIYTMLAVLVAPALTELGVNRLAAHLFLFYMGMLSMITPPVCMATFTAASIAGTNFWKAGLSGMRFGIVAYIIPFVFPFSLGLIMESGALNVVISVATAVIGIFGISWGLTGYMFREIGPILRILLFASGVAVLPSPMSGDLALAANLAGLAVGAAIVAMEAIAVSRERKAFRHDVGAVPLGEP